MSTDSPLPRGWHSVALAVCAQLPGPLSLGSRDHAPHVPWRWLRSGLRLVWLRVRRCPCDPKRRRVLRLRLALGTCLLWSCLDKGPS